MALKSISVQSIDGKRWLCKGHYRETRVAYVYFKWILYVKRGIFDRRKPFILYIPTFMFNLAIFLNFKTLLRATWTLIAGLRPYFSIIMRQKYNWNVPLSVFIFTFVKRNQFDFWMISSKNYRFREKLKG